MRHRKLLLAFGGLVGVLALSYLASISNPHTTWDLPRLEESDQVTGPRHQSINGEIQAHGELHRLGYYVKNGAINVSSKALLEAKLRNDIPCTKTWVEKTWRPLGGFQSVAASLHGVLQPTETKENQTLTFDAGSFRSRVTDVTEGPIHFLPNYKNPCWVETIPEQELRYSDTHSNLRTGFLEGSSPDTAAQKLQSLQDSDSRTWRLRCLPYFYLAGFPKCGTTDLYHKIVQHPEIADAGVKEMQWWGRYRYGRGGSAGNYKPVSFSRYLDNYKKAGECMLRHFRHTQHMDEWHHMVTGDGSPATVWDNHHWSQFPENANFTEPTVLSMHLIRQLTPGARFIVITRNPTERCYSDYMGVQPKDDRSPTYFHDVVKKGVAAYKRCLQTRPRKRCLYDAENDIAEDGEAIRLRRLRIGMYSEFLEEWLQVFPREQFLILRNEDYRDRPAETLGQIFNFLGLTPLPRNVIQGIVDLPRENKSRLRKKFGDMSPETKQLLDEFYAPYTRNLSVLLQDEKFLWKDV